MVFLILYWVTRLNLLLKKKKIEFDNKGLLDWLIWAHILVEALVRQFERDYENKLWDTNKLFSAYFHKLSRIAYDHMLHGIWK